MIKIDHRILMVSDDTKGFTTQIARPNIIKPNTSLTVFSQSPVFGNHLPAETPIKIKGMPKPKLSDERANMPLNTLPLSPITINVATKGGATHAVTNNAESTPTTSTPM